MLMIALRVGPVSASQATVAAVLVGLRKRKKMEHRLFCEADACFWFHCKMAHKNRYIKRQESSRRNAKHAFYAFCLFA